MHQLQHQTWEALTNDIAGFEYLEESVSQGIYAHAYLIQGWNEPRRRLVTDLLALSMACSNALNKPCHTCGNCESFMASHNPDLMRIETLSAVQNIGVDEVRAVHRFVSLSSANKRIVIVRDAACMTTQAANAFLKILEEPPQNVHILLDAGLPHTLPPTIASRCVTITITGIEDRAVSPAGEASKLRCDIEEVLSHDLASQYMWLDTVIRDLRKSESANSESIREYVLSLISTSEEILRDDLYQIAMTTVSVNEGIRPVNSKGRQSLKSLKKIRKGLGELAEARSRIFRFDNPQLAFEQFFMSQAL